jgi:hypothetical protein
MARPGVGQRLDWRLRTALYGDNTEFFTPYRVGETILGGQVTTWLSAKPGPRTEVRVGFFADRRWGSDRFTDSLKPVLSFRYKTRHTLAVLGTLETVDRHGLLEPLMVTTRELTTPIEYGMQWIERRGRFQGNTWVNWQKLNTSFEREQFELGMVLGLRAARVLDLKAQHLWYHRGGQLFDANVPVTNNRVTAVGASVHDSLATVGRASFMAAEIWSEGHIDPHYPTGRPGKGHGTYLRAAVTPWNWAEVFGILWRGHDFSGDAGDQNYSSTGHDPAFYRSARKYLELGVMRRVPIEGGATLDAEWRFHRIDDEKSIAFFNSKWEISYRVVVRAPIDVVLHH